MRYLELFTSLLLLIPPADVSRAFAAETSESLLKKAQAVLAKLEGNIHVAGLKQPVEVLRDRWGISHVYARSEHDLYLSRAANRRSSSGLTMA